MKRIVRSTATDTLLAAMEKADEMEDVLVIYYAKDGFKGHCFNSEGMKSSEALWLIEQYKAWLLGMARRPTKTDGDSDGDQWQ
jgi:hypothetical protein